MADRPAAAAVVDALEAMRCGTKIRLDALRDGRMSARTGAQVATIVEAALADAPPSGLPAVLSSVEDVARVCEAAGLTECDPDAAGRRRFIQADLEVIVSADTRPVLLDPGQWSVERTGWRTRGTYGSPSLLLYAAIQAARGGEPDV